jgi:hypothetical protein
MRRISMASQEERNYISSFLLQNKFLMFPTLLIPDNSNISNIKSTNPSSYNLSIVSGISEGIVAKFVFGIFTSL